LLDPLLVGAVGLAAIVGTLYLISPRGTARDDSAKRLLGASWRMLYGSATGAGLVFVAHWIGGRYGLNGWVSFGATVATAIAVVFAFSALRDKLARRRAEQAWP